VAKFATIEDYLAAQAEPPCGRVGAVKTTKPRDVDIS
jgi:hypothetical protein